MIATDCQGAKDSCGLLRIVKIPTEYRLLLIIKTIIAIINKTTIIRLIAPRTAGTPGEIPRHH